MRLHSQIILFALAILLFLHAPVTFAEFGFVSATYSADEDSGSINVDVDLQAGCFGECYNVITIDYAVVGGTATAGQDYEAIPNPQTLTWTSDGIQSFTINILPDSLLEADETINLQLSNCLADPASPSPATCESWDILVTPGGDSAVATIINDDFPGILALTSSSSTVAEGNTATFSVSRTGGSSGSVSVDYSLSDGSAVAGQDYIAQSGTLTWTDGDIADKTITLSTLNDTLDENDENFNLTLSNPGGGASLGNLISADITIRNVANPGEIGFDDTSFSVAEGGQITASVTRAGGSAGPASVDFATVNGSAVAGRDYTESSGTLSWADGESGSKTITLRTLTDSVIEGDESFSVRLSNPTGSATLTASSATVIITNTTLSLGDLPGLNENQKAVADALDNICGSASGALLERCNDLYNSGLTTGQLIDALDSITPSQISAQGNVAIDFGFQQLQIIHGRITSLRQKKDGARISLSGFNVNSYGQNVPLGQMAENLIYQTLDEAGEGDALRDSPLGFFIKGQLTFGDKNGTSLERGFDVETKNITLGLDYQFTDELFLGMAGGYSYANSEFENDSGDMETHSGNFSIYGSYFLPEDFYLDWVLSYSINDYENTRRIRYPGLVTSADSTPEGDQYGGSIGFGKDMYYRNFFFNPYARIEYLRTGVDEYTENGGDGLALRVSEQSMFSMATTLGGQVSQAISMPWGIIAPGVRFEWRHQFRDDERTIQSQFISAENGGGAFSIKTDEPDRDYFNLGASLAVTLPEGRSAFLRYETRLGQNDISNHTIEAAIRIPF